MMVIILGFCPMHSLKRNSDKGPTDASYDMENISELLNKHSPLTERHYPVTEKIESCLTFLASHSAQTGCFVQFMAARICDNNYQLSLHSKKCTRAYNDWIN